MAVLNNTGILAGASAAGGGDYKIEKSLRFNPGDTSYLERTFDGGDGGTKHTFSVWVKTNPATTHRQSIFTCGPYTSGTGYRALELHITDNEFVIATYGTGHGTCEQYSLVELRDPSAWYHFVVTFDSTESTDVDRVKFWINGSLQPASSFSSRTHPTEDSVLGWDNDDVGRIGERTTGSATSVLDGYLADFHYIDGTAKDASEFGETHEDTGQWVAKKYAGTYGTNGFYLKFNGTNLGEDSSGNGNNWTATNLTQGLNTISSPNMPTWDTVDTGWTVTNSDKDASTSPTGISGYQHVITGNLALDTTYHFFLSRDEYTTLGGWFLTDSASDAQDTVPNEYSSGNSIGHRAGNSTVGTYGTYATANSTSNATGQLSGFPTTQETDFEIVINRTVDKVWMRVAGASTWQGGGDPSNTSSTATFLIPDGANMVFGYVSYDNSATTANITDSVGDPLEIDVSNDSPTTFDDDGNGTGNYCTLSPFSSNGTLVQGNLQPHNGSGNFTGVSSWGFDSGKWYGEFTLGSDHSYPGIGFTYEGGIPSVGWMATQAPYFFVNDGGPLVGLSSYPGGAMTWNSGVAIASTVLEEGVYQLALDCENGKGWIGYQDTWYNDEWNVTGSAGNPATGANPTFTLSTDKTWYFFLHANDTKWTANFGQRTFSYTKPSGFLSPNTYNLPDPVIADPSKHYNTVLYEGDPGVSNAITGVGFEPGFVWAKNRDQANAHNLFDQVRGETKVLYADFNAAEDPITTFEFTSDGFTTDDSADAWNGNFNYTSWHWKAASSDTSVAVGGLNSTLYDQSDTWSDDVTGDPAGGDEANYGRDHAFDGLVGTYAQADNGDTYTWTPSGGYAFSGAIEIEAYYYGSSASMVIVHAGGTSDVSSQMNASGSLTINNITGITSPITSIAWHTEDGSNYSSITRLWIGGKLLVDNGLSVTNIPTIASTGCRANPEAGFSIVTYTGTGSAGNLAHGLNATPELIMVKRRDTAANWVVGHPGIAAAEGLYLNDHATPVSATDFFDSHSGDNSNVFSMGANERTGLTSATYVAYVWAPVEGYSKFGEYTGNGTDGDGPFVLCGFKPAWILIKRIDTATHWVMFDNKINPYNEASNSFAPSATGSETWKTSDEIDILSNGFKLRSNDSVINGSASAKYIFAAFADKPFKYANAR